MYGLIFVEVVLLLLFSRIVAYPTFRYFKDSKKLRRFPSIPTAAFTNAWGVLHQYCHTRTMAVHAAHQKYGKVVRVGPDHVSFATTEAIRDIYGHGTPMIKDDFYKSFNGTHLNISDAQEKSVHNVKRRRFAAAFAQKSIVQLEEVMDDHLERMIKQLDSKCGGGDDVDMKGVMLRLMYDAISVMMYAQYPKFSERESTVTTAETPDGRLYQTDMYQSMLDSTRIGISTGWAPDSIKTLQFLTQWHSGWAHGAKFRDVTIHLVRNRVRMDTERVKQGLPPLDDFFTTMLYSREKEPLGLEFGELISEAANIFNASGENTEIALTNIVWLLAGNPKVVAKLRKELNTAFDWKTTSIPKYDQIKELPYLRACIDEGLRLRPSIEGGLPRMVPDGGMMVGGHWLEGGTTVSVSTHTIHRDSEVFHEDPEHYVPERWLRDDANSMQRGFLAFSQGGRGCIGRNIAYFEMVLVIAILFSRYDIALESPDWVLPIREAFSAHTTAFPVKITRRMV